MRRYQSAGARALIAATFLLPSEGMAEVCDKVVGDDWMPQDGPVGVFIDWSSTWPFASGLGVLLGLAVLFRSRVLVWVLVAGSLLSVVLEVAFDLTSDERIRRAAITEGCVHPSADLIQIVGWLAIAALSVLIVRSGLLSPGSRKRNEY